VVIYLVWLQEKNLKAVVTVTIVREDGFEPIGIDHASGCPLEPCLHRGAFINRVPFLNRVYTVLTPCLHRVYTVSTPCLHASAETTRISNITRCIPKSLYNTYMCHRCLLEKEYLPLIARAILPMIWYRERLKFLDQKSTCIACD
jgi:hypothetical protein